MENLRENFRKNGQTLTTHTLTEKSFYCCLYLAKHNLPQSVRSKNANQIRQDIFELEKKNAMYFHLFQPMCISCDGNHSAVDCLQRDFERMMKEKKSITPRECFAAAEYLQRCIYVLRYQHFDECDLTRLKGYIFAPIDKTCLDAEPIFILMFYSQNGVVEFGNIRRNDTVQADLTMCPGHPVNKKHTHCFGFRFANDFHKLFDKQVSYGRTSNVQDLFHRLSLEFYDTELHHERILNIVCNFESEEDNLDLFCKYADNAVTDETSFNDKKKILMSHVEKIRKREKAPGECELYALASVYNVDLILEKTGRGEWQSYMSVVSNFLCCFDSPIILMKCRGNEWNYDAKVTTQNTCSCCQDIPVIKGCIGEITTDIHATVCTYFENPLYTLTYIAFSKIINYIYKYFQTRMQSFIINFISI